MTVRSHRHAGPPTSGIARTIRRLGRARPLGCVVVLAMVSACGTPQHRDATHLETSASVGGLSLDNGFEDRLVGQTNASLILPSGLGVHAEAVGEKREEDAVFTSAGVSYHTRHYVPKVQLGTSTDNEGIQPELFAEAELTYISDAEAGYLLTPLVSYRKYRNSAEESALGLTGTKYFGTSGDYLWIGQGFGRLTYADPGANIGYSGGGSLAYSKYDSWSIGLLAEAGRSRYDSVLGAGNVVNDFYSIRPFASVRLSESVELFGRLEYYNTDFYDAQGVFIGIKFSTDIPETGDGGARL